MWLAGTFYIALGTLGADHHLEVAGGPQRTRGSSRARRWDNSKCPGREDLKLHKIHTDTVLESKSAGSAVAAEAFPDLKMMGVGQDGGKGFEMEKRVLRISICICTGCTKFDPHLYSLQTKICCISWGIELKSGTFQRRLVRINNGPWDPYYILGDVSKSI